MAEKYQTFAQKSTRKFEVLGRNELAMSVPLPLVEVWEDLQPEVEHLTGIAGLKIIQAVIEDEVSRRVGPRASSGGRLRVPALGSTARLCEFLRSEGAYSPAPSAHTGGSGGGI